jgi:hypothetical protein
LLEIGLEEERKLLFELGSGRIVLSHSLYMPYRRCFESDEACGRTSKAGSSLAEGEHDHTALNRSDENFGRLWRWVRWKSSHKAPIAGFQTLLAIVIGAFRG